MASKPVHRGHSQGHTFVHSWQRATYRRRQATWRSRLKKLPPGAGNYVSLVTGLPTSARASNLATLAPAMEATHLEGKLRIIGEYKGKMGLVRIRCTAVCGFPILRSAKPGVGQRGSSAVGRLLRSTQMAGAEVWCLDSDAKTLKASGVKNSILQDSKEPLPQQALEQMIGIGAADKDGKGNVNVGDGGVAFVLTSAGSVPGHSDMLLQLVQSLRSAGYFTAVAMTQPFEFEGARKSQAADDLVNAMQDIAHLVAIIEQDVLSKVMTNASGSPMTVAEATLIADNALEHTVRCVLAALQAPEILKSTQGALIWHGREMRRFRRLLSPPLQRLLSRPGSAALGRGVAAMPTGYGQRLGDAQSLMHLASDAVRAAAESPFLEASVGRASGVLCCVTLPIQPPCSPEDVGDSVAQRQAREYNASKAAARLAVQAAAGALLSVCPCDEVIMCCAPPESLQGCQHDEEGTLKVEVSLLVLHDPTLNPALPPPTLFTDPPPPPLRQSTQVQTSAPHRAAAQTVASSPHEQLSSLKDTVEAQGRSRVQRLPASTWGAMSAMAGGPLDIHPQEPGTDTLRSLPHSHVIQGQRSLSTPASAPQAPAQWQGRSPSTGRSPGNDRVNKAVTARDVVTASARAGSAEGSGTIADQLLDNFVAQSLDLPPKAAKWRQSQRAKSERPRLIVQAPEATWQLKEEPDSGLKSTLRTLLTGPSQDFDIRQRTYAILERDRGDILSPDQQD